MPERIEVVVFADPRLARLRDSKRIIQEELYRAGLESALWLEGDARLLAPKVTGNLARAIRGGVRRTSESTFETRLEVSESAPYGVYVNYGTGIYHFPDAHTPWGAKPELIPDRRHPGHMKVREFLRWYGADRQPVFRRTVRGARPHFFIEGAVEASRERIERLYRHDMPDRIRRRLEGE